MREIAVLSGKGGTGKSSLTAALATISHKVVVADCDVDAANMHLILEPVNHHEEHFTTGHKAIIDYDVCTNCGLCMEYCRFDAISLVNDTVTISETSCDGCKLCSRICPVEAIEMAPQNRSKWFSGTFRNGYMVHARLAPGEENSGKLVNIVRENAKSVAKKNQLETIIIDGPPGTGCPAISTLTGTSAAILVTEPSRSGFHDLKRIVELTAGFKVPSSVVINKFDLNPDIAKEISDWCQEQNIPVIGKLPFDPKVVEAMVQCKSITEWESESPVSKEIVEILKKLELNPLIKTI